MLLSILILQRAQVEDVVPSSFKLSSSVNYPYLFRFYLQTLLEFGSFKLRHFVLTQF
jgi:hypothetical protein